MSSPRDVIDDVRSLLAGVPVYLAGSLVSADAHGFNSYHDVDLFTPNPMVLMTTGQRLLDNGYTFADRFDRVWHRWLRYGFKGWHTNSLRLMSPAGVETNLVYKMVDGHPTTSLSQVLESFDFGLLGMGYDLETDTYRDLRPYLFPTEYTAAKKQWTTAQPWPLQIPLPMMPNKRDAWRNGFISQYNGLRECGRYAKYHGYGYDLSLVKDDLVVGYRKAADYYAGHHKFDLQPMAQIYDAIASHIELDNIPHLQQASKQIDYNDSLDVIMEALE